MLRSGGIAVTAAVKKSANRSAWGPRVLVFSPLALLTAMFAAFAGLLFFRTQLSTRAAAVLAVAGAAVYFAVIAMIGRFGLSHVLRLEGLSRADSLTGLPNRRALHDDAARLAPGNEEIAVA